ncbi:hypothetical protein L798_06167 [Zootermopsis nevadensis]|uniref:Uncharacterized protein n=1 Tax=Zootermopsis nevadensis TaxID=136037 RepID=A0A067RH45_ZOONE|nr:hypothetical protein L798_06167 [Zootermopsis nevadensis]
MFFKMAILRDKNYDYLLLLLNDVFIGFPTKADVVLTVFPAARSTRCCLLPGLWKKNPECTVMQNLMTGRSISLITVFEAMGLRVVSFKTQCEQELLCAVPFLTTHNAE